MRTSFHTERSGEVRTPFITLRIYIFSAKAPSDSMEFNQHSFHLDMSKFSTRLSLLCTRGDSELIRVSCVVVLYRLRFLEDHLERGIVHYFEFLFLVIGHSKSSNFLTIGCDG